MSEPPVQYYMNYTIWLSDPAEYGYAAGLTENGFLKMTPREAASTFGIPYPYPSGDTSQIPRGINFYYPFTPGAEFNFPLATGLFVNDAVLTTRVPGQAGKPESIWPIRADGLFTWSGNIIKMAGAGIENNPPPNAISQRRWFGGRELSSSYEGGSGIAETNYSLDASRVMGGGGMWIRGASTSNAWLRNVLEFRPGLTPKISWERFYIRVRKYPITENVAIWKVNGTPSTSAGFGIKLHPSGNLQGYNMLGNLDQIDAGPIFAPQLNQWYKVDIVFRYAAGVGTIGKIVIYINGILTYTFTAPTNAGLGANNTHTGSELGAANWGDTDTTVEVDLDDWVCADPPANMDLATLTFIDENYPIDWILGSHIRVHYSVGVNQSGWTPIGAGIGVVNQILMPTTRQGTSELVSAISGATIESLTDAPTQDIQDTVFLTIGSASALVAVWAEAVAGSTTAQLGYKKAGGAAVTLPQTQTQIEAIERIMYLPSGMIIPDEIAPWSAVFSKTTNTSAGEVSMLTTVVEYLGVWGPEDDPQFVFPITRLTWLHNARYFNTQYGYLGSNPDAPVFSIGGTYVGNGTYQEIPLPGPCHFLWIRGTTGSTSGIKFFGAATGPHKGTTDEVISNVRMWFDAINGLFKFSVTGAALSECNISGITYQYIAFCDPGMRFNLCGAFGHGSTIASPQTNPLIVPDFMPNAGFCQSDALSPGSNAIGLWFKGPGNTGTQVNPLDASALEPNGFTFSSGVLNTYSKMHSGTASSNASYNYSLWRTADSGGECLGVMIQVTTFTGDGTASRIIPLTPLSGRYPLFVLVIPASAGQLTYVRDPSHTGLNSSAANTVSTYVTNAITAVGIDSITVGTSCNVNGRIYNVFTICGDVTGMVNGLFWPTPCINNGPGKTPEEPDAAVNIITDGGLVLGGQTPITMLKDVSGIYTLVKDQHHDKLIDRQTGQTTINVEIPDPEFKTGYLGG